MIFRRDIVPFQHLLNTFLNSSSLDSVGSRQLCPSLHSFADLFEHPRSTTARDSLDSAITDGADYWVGYHQLGLAWELANEWANKLDNAQHAFEGALDARSERLLI